jgi:hypothetical protein
VIAWLIVAAASIRGYAQAGFSIGAVSGSSQGATNTATISRTIHGRVTNALDGAGIPRTLVMLNSRAVLTDSQGRFQFTDFTDTQAYATLTKPGFSQTTDAPMGGGRQRVPDLDATLEFKMYPDAIVTGVVTGRDGLPLSRVSVALKRAMFMQNGWRWMPINTVQTDLHGEYRFRTPAGRIQLSLGYVARSQDTGEAILPVTVPANSSTDSLNYFELTSGQERRIDLRPTTGPVYPVQLHVEPQDTPRGMQVTALTPAGESFQVSAQGGSAESRISLPRGTYTLQARIENRDTSMEGSTRVVVTGKSTDAAVIHLEPAAVLPVELSVDPASTSTSGSTGSAQPSGQSTTVQPPDLRQFNLRLHNLAQASAPGQQDIGLRQKEDHSYEFRCFPGRYRLEALSAGTWYVESATSGVTNLMSNEIVIGSGGSGTPIRIVANNTQGMVKLSAQFPADVDTLYFYLLPRGPSLVMANPLMVGNSGNPTTSVQTRVPVGSYLAIVTDHRVEDDLRNPDVLARFSAGGKTIDVSASATASVTLDIAREKTQ